MQNVTLVKHPLIDHSLTILRDKNTQTGEFRQHAAVVSKILIIEASKNFALRNHKIQTPLSPMLGKQLKEEVIIIPVLRAGLAMLFAVQDFLPSVPVGFIGLERDENTAIARKYYQKLPQLITAKQILILDPMLATGGSAQDTVLALYEKGARDISIVCIVSAPEGIERMQKNHPDIKIFTPVIDTHLNDKKYIVPGLGDFGDRYFGT